MTSKPRSIDARVAAAITVDWGHLRTPPEPEPGTIGVHSAVVSGGDSREPTVTLRGIDRLDGDELATLIYDLQCELSWERDAVVQAREQRDHAYELIGRLVPIGGGADIRDALMTALDLYDD